MLFGKRAAGKERPGGGAQVWVVVVGIYVVWRINAQIIIKYNTSQRPQSLYYHIVSSFAFHLIPSAGVGSHIVVSPLPPLAPTESLECLLCYYYYYSYYQSAPGEL